MAKALSIFRSGPDDWLRFMQAYLWLFRARRLMNRARGNDWLFSGEAPSDTVEVTDQDRVRIKQRVAAVSRASRYPFEWAVCLQRSLALREWMAKDGMLAEVRYGVRRNQGEFQAHAWVVYDGKIVNDSLRHVSTFAPLKSVDEYGQGSSGQIRHALVTSRTESESVG